MLVSIKYHHSPSHLLEPPFEQHYFKLVNRLSMLATLMNFLLLVICFFALAIGCYWLLFVLILYNKNRINISKTTYSQYDCTFFWLPFKYSMKIV